MAQTEDHKKKVYVHSHKKKKPGGTYKKVDVSTHYRSTPNKKKKE